MKNSVALIPARGGSKSIPHKNLTDLAGKPLIFWTIKAAIDSNVEHVFVSSDCNEIVSYAKSLGVNTIARPDEYSDDDAKAFDVVKHALSYLNNCGIVCDALVYLQPTSPLRTSEHIDDALRIFDKKFCSSVISVTPVPHNFIPESIMTNTNGELKHYLDVEPNYQRQKKPSYLARNGPAIVIAKAMDILKQSKLYTDPMYGYEMPNMSSIDVDTPEDLDFVKKLIVGSRYFNETS